MMETLFNFTQLLKEEAATVTIIHPKSSKHTDTKCLIETDLSFEIQSNFSDMDSSGGVFSGAATKGAQLGTSALGMSQRIFKTTQQTLSQWDGSTKPSFTFPITLVSHSPDYDIIGEAMKILDGVLPTFSGISIISPHEYTTSFHGLGQLDVSRESNDFNNNMSLRGLTSRIPSFGEVFGRDAIINSIKNTFSVRYSNWFRADHLVMTHASITASREASTELNGSQVISSNKPIYIKMSTTFQPAFLPSKKEVRGWFNRPL